VKLEAFARLRPRPVHEEPDLAVHQLDGAEHDDDVGGRREPGEHAEGDSESAEELAHGHQVAHRSEHRHDAGEAVPSEGAEQLLRAVRGEDDADQNARRQERPVERRQPFPALLSMHGNSPFQGFIACLR
jgi:hypothetical protein